MKIGIDGTCWWNKRGFGRMARELLGAMFVLDSDHEFYLFIDQEPDADLEQFDINLVRVFPHRPLTAVFHSVWNKRSGLISLKHNLS